MNPNDLNPQQVTEQLSAWQPVIYTALTGLFALATFILAKVNALKQQVDTHGDRLHDLALQQASPVSAPALMPPVQTPAQAPTMRTPAIVAMIGIGFLSAGLLLAGCQTPGGQSAANNVADFLVSPANEAIVGIAVQAGVNSLIASAGNKIPSSVQQPLATAADAAASGLSSALLSSAAAALRTQQGTAQAASPGAVANAVTGAGTPTLAPVIASAVSGIAQAGIPPNAANEAVASALDAVAASKAP